MGAGCQTLLVASVATREFATIRDYPEFGIDSAADLAIVNSRGRAGCSSSENLTCLRVKMMWRCQHIQQLQHAHVTGRARQRPE